MASAAWISKADLWDQSLGLGHVYMLFKAMGVSIGVWYVQAEFTSGFQHLNWDGKIIGDAYALFGVTVA